MPTLKPPLKWYMEEEIVWTTSKKLIAKATQIAEAMIQSREEICGIQLNDTSDRRPVLFVTKNKQLLKDNCHTIKTSDGAVFYFGRLRDA